MKSKENFAQSIELLCQYKHGCHNSGCMSDYRHGFFTAVNMWLNSAYDKTYDLGDPSFNASDGFRHVVDTYHDGFEGVTDEFCKGYEKALRMFREAKGL